MEWLKRILFGISLWMWWILASILGIWIGLVIASVLFQIPKILLSRNLPIVFANLALPIVGGFLGGAHAWVFQRYIPQPRRWVIASLLGYSAGAVLMAIGKPPLPYIPDSLDQYEGYFFLLAGFVATISVWMILRIHFPRAIVWAFACGLIITMSLFALSNIDFYPSEYNAIDSLYLAFFLSFPAGLLSGPVMILALDRIETPKILFSNIKSIFSEDGRLNDEPSQLEAGRGFLSTKLILANLFVPGIILGSLTVVMVAIGPRAPRYFENRGLETTPEEFVKAQQLWDNRPFSHYRLVATYWNILDHCHEDVEVLNEEVVSIYPTDDCQELGHRSVSGLFDLFNGYVGEGQKRPEVGNGCEFWYVDAIYDEELGYPKFMQNQTILMTDERLQYVTREHSYSCLLFGPITYTLEIESITPLP